jgi:tRNA dimethylallyltransferase
MKCLVAIVGPTAVGKSRLGNLIAEDFQTEIINADSRQIYKFMDIGTAKPSVAERAHIPHHLLDIILPDQNYSIALYQQAATTAISEICTRKKLPLLIGGSGQYVWSLIEGWQIPEVPPDPTFRGELEQKATASGAECLFRELEEIDPVAAARISPNNLRRIIRALEIHRKTGRKPSELQYKKGTDYPVLIIGLTANREKLYEMIDARVERMVESGLIDEVKCLINMGYRPELPSMSSLGYREIAAHLNNDVDLPGAIERIKFETHRFARSQYAWFHLNDERIKWFQADDDIKSKINYTINNFIENVGQV